MSTLKLHLSDEKIQMLSDFIHHIPFPHSSSMMGLDDSVDGHVEPVLYAIIMVSGQKDVFMALVMSSVYDIHFMKKKKCARDVLSCSLFCKLCSFHVFDSEQINVINGEKWKVFFFHDKATFSDLCLIEVVA